jgi:phosphate transport system permease protein
MNSNYERFQVLIARRKLKERLFEGLLFCISCTSVVTVFLIAYTLFVESLPFFQEVKWSSFFFDHEWTPLFDQPKHGILSLISATLTTTWIALFVAGPIGLILASFLSEFSSVTTREIAKPILEILAGIPTVVYGYFALMFVTPWLQKWIPNLSGFNMLSAGLVMGIMIIPYLSSLIEEAMRAVSPEVREASAALGASKLETTFKVVLPSASSGVIAAFILAASRALGETMIVAIAAGGIAQIAWNPMQAGQTLTAFIVQVSLGDVPHGSIGYQSIFATGFTLFIMTLTLNLMGFYVRKRTRSQ